VKVAEKNGLNTTKTKIPKHACPLEKLVFANLSLQRIERALAAADVVVVDLRRPERRAFGVRGPGSILPSFPYGTWDVTTSDHQCGCF